MQIPLMRASYSIHLMRQPFAGNSQDDGSCNSFSFVPCATRYSLRRIAGRRTNALRAETVLWADLYAMTGQVLPQWRLE